MVASATSDGSTRLWDASTHAELGRALRGGGGAINAIAFSRDGRTLAAAGNRGTVSLWDVQARKPSGRPLGGQQGSVSGVTFSGDGRELASAGRDANRAALAVERAWGVRPAAARPRGQPPSSSTTCIAFSPDGSYAGRCQLRWLRADVARAARLRAGGPAALPRLAIRATRAPSPR